MTKENFIALANKLNINGETMETVVLLQKNFNKDEFNELKNSNCYNDKLTYYNNRYYNDDLKRMICCCIEVAEGIDGFDRKFVNDFVNQYKDNFSVMCVTYLCAAEYEHLGWDGLLNMIETLLWGHYKSDPNK